MRSGRGCRTQTLWVLCSTPTVLFPAPSCPLPWETTVIPAFIPGHRSEFTSGKNPASDSFFLADLIRAFIMLW